MALRSGLLVAILVFAACGGGTEGSQLTSSEPVTAQDGCADVIDVAVRAAGNSFDFDVSVKSADTGWEKYADAWEVRGSAGEILGIRELLHPHETEQPFTRSLSGVEIPPLLTSVTIAARDSVLGFCGESMTVALPGRS